MRDEMIARAIMLGESIENSESHIVTYLLKKAREAAIQAVRELCTCNPCDIDTLRDHQSKVARYDDLISWLKAAAAEASHALHTLSDEDRSVVEREIFGSDDD